MAALTNAQRQAAYRKRKCEESGAKRVVAETLEHVQLAADDLDAEVWWRNVAGVMSQAVTCRVIGIAGESFIEFQARVFAASGPGPWDHEADESMRRRIRIHRSLGVNANVPQQRGPAQMMPMKAG